MDFKKSWQAKVSPTWDFQLNIWLSTYQDKQRKHSLDAKSFFMFRNLAMTTVQETEEQVNSSSDNETKT